MTVTAEFLHAAVEAGAQALYDRERPTQPGWPSRYSNAPEALQNHYRANVGQVVTAAIEAVEVLHALSTTFAIAQVETRNFEFQGVGADEHEARLALRVALEHHRADTPACAWNQFEINDMADEANLTTYTIGKSYRDGSEI